MRVYSELEERPAYPVAEVARYLRISSGRARRWGAALLPEGEHLPQSYLSYVNLLELHVLKAMRIRHEVPLQRIRRALAWVGGQMPSAHPLLDREFATDGLDLFLEHGSDVINLSKSGQVAMRDVIQLYLSRIEWRDNAQPQFFPFVRSGEPDEPKAISIQPAVAFGRPVLAGTGVATDVVAARFYDRESSADLALEYGVPVSVIEEAIRWELPLPDAA